MNPLQVLLAVLLILVLPGYTLTRAIYPVPPASWRHPWAMTLFLTMVLSLAITVLTGAVLGFLPHPEGTRGWFQGSATGAPILEGVLLTLSLVFFLVGLARGAYPRLYAPPRERAARPRAIGESEDASLTARVRALARPGDAPARTGKGRRKDP